MKVALTNDNLDSLINSSGINIILVGSSSCNPCKAIGNRIDEFLKDNKDINALYAPIECFREYFASLTILSVPTVLVYVNGRLQIKESGYFSLDKILNSIIRIKELM